MQKRCPYVGCKEWFWADAALQHHFIREHALPMLRDRVANGWVSDWDCALPTHKQVMTMDSYSYHLTPWQDEIIAILESRYGRGGWAA